jgi:hypothetical protein
MTPSFRRFAFAFGTTFSVLYVIVLAKDLALFTVFPSLGVVLPGTHRSRDVAAPAMAFLAPAIYWRLGKNRRTRGIDVRPCCRAVTRAVDASVLARMGMVGSRTLDDRVRLSHTALVSPLTGGRPMSLSIRLRQREACPAPDSTMVTTTGRVDGAEVKRQAEQA